MTPEYSDCRDAFGDEPCDVHVKPDTGPAHRDSAACWCEPEVYYEHPETMSRAWAHKVLQ